MATKETPVGIDPELGARVIESLVVRGDVSALSPADRARFYVQTCEGLGLNPHAQPFAFLRLNGKEILYATKGATDQLAALHRVNREIVDGPKVIDLAGTKLVYAVCRATLPNGRIEHDHATVPLIDPVNVLMKCVTKAKRRATLSILGLGLLDETELETIPANVQGPSAPVDLGAISAQPAVATPHEGEVTKEETREREAITGEGTPVTPTAMDGFYQRLEEIELPGESVSVWMKYRAELAAMPVPDREAAWKALCRKTEEVGQMKNAKVWLKKAIAEEDNRHASAS